MVIWCVWVLYIFEKNETQFLFEWEKSRKNTHLFFAQFSLFYSIIAWLWQFQIGYNISWSRIHSYSLLTHWIHYLCCGQKIHCQSLFWSACDHITKSINVAYFTVAVQIKQNLNANIPQNQDNNVHEVSNRLRITAFYAVTKIHLWHDTLTNALKIYFHTKWNERKWLFTSTIWCDC